MAEDTAKITITASDIPDGIMQAERVVGKHNLLHDLGDYADELKEYAPPEKDNSGSLNVVGTMGPSNKDSLIAKIVREHRYLHDKITEYPECANDFWEGPLDNTLETIDRAVFKIAKAQARRAENDKCDMAKGAGLLDKLVGAFKGE